MAQRKTTSAARAPRAVGAGDRLRAWSRRLADVVGRLEATTSNGTAVDCDEAIEQVLATLEGTRARGSTVFVVGNGGSTAVAAHFAVDLVNTAKIAASTLSDSATMTCMANDYGYGEVYAAALATVARPHDVLVAISSSGRSSNIVNAALAMREHGNCVITLTGFDPANALRRLGQVNVYLPCDAYGIVEVGHQTFLHFITDSLALRKERSA